MEGRERRSQTRRRADKALRQTVEILQLLDRMTRGERVDFGECYADLVGLRNGLGRREEDRLLAESLCTALESLSADILGLMGEARTLRRVRLTKVSGRKNTPVEVQSSLVGWEEARPKVGRNYTLFKDEGGVFRSAVVLRVGEGEFQTRNSLYRVEVIEERGLPG
jgi:hypothetical protein